MSKFKQKSASEVDWGQPPPPNKPTRKPPIYGKTATGVWDFFYLRHNRNKSISLTTL